MIKYFAAASVMVLASGSPALAQTIYPIDRAEILAGAKFDFKVEFPDRVDPAKLKVTVNGEDYAAAFGRAGTFIEREDGKDQSALMLRDVALIKPGRVTVEVGDGTRQPQAGVDGLRYRAAQGEERDPVHRRRDVARASRRRAAAFQGHRGRQEPRQAGDRRHAAHGAGGDRRLGFDHHRFGQRGQRLCHRPQDRGQRHGRLCRPHRQIHSTIPRSKPSPASPSAGSIWASASSPTPRSRMRRRPRWWRIPAAAPPMTRSSSSILRPSPTC